MRLYEIHNEFTGEIIEIKAGRSQIKRLVNAFIRENNAAECPCFVRYLVVPGGWRKIIDVNPCDPRKMWYLNLIPGD